VGRLVAQRLGLAVGAVAGGSPNLFCTRTVRGRYQFVFYKDAVLVFDLRRRNRDPLDANHAFKWAGRKP
jgi:hypothetical protein